MAELRSSNREKSYRWIHFSFRSDISINVLKKKKKEETMLSKNHLDNSIGYIYEIYTFKVSIVIKIATKIKNVPVLLTYLFLEIVFVLCPSRNHV